MTALLTAPTAALLAPARPEGPATPPAARRPAPAMRPDGPDALRPVETASRGLDLRFEDAQGRPTGPPPAFQVTLLAAMREAAFRSPPDGIAPSRVRLPDAGTPSQIDRRL